MADATCACIAISRRCTDTRCRKSYYVKVTSANNNNKVIVEKDALKRAQIQPNVCKWLGWCRLEEKENNKLSYAIVTEAYTGGSLMDLFERTNLPLDETQSRSIFFPLCDAVDHLHHNGIIHCDIKLENIVLDGEGNPYLIDFGLANSVGPAGSYSFCAPEKFNGGILSPSNDVWSIGICIFATLSCTFPFSQASTVDRRFEALNELQKNGNKKTCNIVFKNNGTLVPFSADVIGLLDGMLTISTKERYMMQKVMSSDGGLAVHEYLNDMSI
jgi:serine/threonine protein kinase